MPFRALVIVVVLAATALPAHAAAWRVRRDWDRAEVDRYARWVGHIHERKVAGSDAEQRATLPQVLGDARMNLLLTPGFAPDSNDPRALPPLAEWVMSKADACGTLPALLLVYYCAVRGLPALCARVRGSGEDIRYGHDNHPVAALDPLAYPDLTAFVRAVCFGEPNYTTGNWRTAPDLERTDTVPVAVSRASTIPGLTLAYNPDGHALAVAGVEPDGRVHFLDSHPDGSITAGQSLAAVQSVLGELGPDRRQWFAGWRMLRLAATVRDRAGRVTGIRWYTNQEMRAYGFSDEQYRDGLAIRAGRPVTIAGRPERVASFPEYARLKLRTTAAVDPADAVREWADELAAELDERATLVQGGWQDVRAHGPIPLPSNIYRAHGRWEDWASPSSDCDRRAAYFLGVDRIEKLVTVAPAARRVALARWLLQLKRRAFAGRKIEYRSSTGRGVARTLADVERRLWLLSFDPNHPPELRWGDAPDHGPAPDSYRREQRLRYRLSRKDVATRLDDPTDPGRPPRELFDAVLGRYTR